MGCCFTIGYGAMMKSGNLEERGDGGQAPPLKLTFSNHTWKIGGLTKGKSSKHPFFGVRKMLVFFFNGRFAQGFSVFRKFGCFLKLIRWILKMDMRPKAAHVASNQPDNAKTCQKHLCFHIRYGISWSNSWTCWWKYISTIANRVLDVHQAYHA